MGEGNVGENRGISITCVAPTKAFNLAGIQTAAVIVPDAHLRHKVSRGLNTDELAKMHLSRFTLLTQNQQRQIDILQER